MNCFYCHAETKGSDLSDEITQYHVCFDCKCEYIARHGIITKIVLQTHTPKHHYIVTLDLVGQQTTLAKWEGSQQFIYKYDGVAAVSPDNIQNKIKTWVWMS